MSVGHFDINCEWSLSMAHTSLSVKARNSESSQSIDFVSHGRYVASTQRTIILKTSALPHSATMTTSVTTVNQSHSRKSTFQLPNMERATLTNTTVIKHAVTRHISWIIVVMITVGHLRAHVYHRGHELIRKRAHLLSKAPLLDRGHCRLANAAFSMQTQQAQGPVHKLRHA